MTINGVEFPWPVNGLDILVSGEPGDPTIGPVRIRVEGEVHVNSPGGTVVELSEDSPRYGDHTLYVEGYVGFPLLAGLTPEPDSVTATPKGGDAFAFPFVKSPDPQFDPAADESSPDPDHAVSPDGWRDPQFEKRLSALTEDDAGFRNWRADMLRRGGHYKGTLSEYRGLLRQRERDQQQMIDMGR